MRYSIISTEIAARGRKKSSVEALNGELNSSSGFILSLLFGVARGARNLRCTEVLLRHKGLQLLAGSVCFGLTGANDLSDMSKRRGERIVFFFMILFHIVSVYVLYRLDTSKGKAFEHAIYWFVMVYVGPLWLNLGRDIAFVTWCQQNFKDKLQKSNKDINQIELILST